MPQVYKSPNSEADPGKTTYLAIRSEDSVIVPPKEKASQVFPRGRQIRQITDGTSKTILVVDASDQQAVIWTKPDDFEPDLDNPLKGLVNQTGLFNAAFCDGSVRSIRMDVAQQTLLRLFDPDDGEPIPPGSY